MKATGIIRRIDELGRIVVPKEIRKNLRIKEGENLEIFVDSEDNIILKKHSLIKNMEDLSQNLTDAIYSYTRHNVIVADNNFILAASGNLKKEYLNKAISLDLEEKISKREDSIFNDNTSISIIENNMLNTAYAISTIIVNGDSIGCILIFDEDNKINDSDYKIIKIASKFLTSHLE